MNKMVSVIIPTYNRAYLVCEAIDSVLNQTYKDFEIIVIDDGSTDDTKEIIEERIKKYSTQIKYFYQKNKGVGAARNIGIKEAKSKYIAFLDSDDIWLPEKLEINIETFSEFPEVKMICSDGYAFNKERTSSKTFFEARKPPKESFFRELLLRNFILTSSIVIEKDCFTSAGLFEENLGIAEDYDLFIRIAKNFKSMVINRPLIKYRTDGDKICHDKIRMYSSTIKALEKITSLYPEIEIEMGMYMNIAFASRYFNLACAQYGLGRFEDARINFIKSIKFYPFAIKKYILYLSTYLPFNFINKEKILSSLYGHD